jgi:hypothetical protein
MITKLTPKIRLVTAKEIIWEINKGPNTKLIKGALKRGSIVTVEFNKNDGKKLGLGHPGKRTETGTVIGVNDAQITLDNTTPDPRTWRINRTASTLVNGSLALNSTAKVESNAVDWTHLA